jgi:hypothetical protein
MTAPTWAALPSQSWAGLFGSSTQPRWRDRAAHRRARSDGPDKPVDGAPVQSNHE